MDDRRIVRVGETGVSGCEGLDIRAILGPIKTTRGEARPHWLPRRPISPVWSEGTGLLARATDLVDLVQPTLKKGCIPALKDALLILQEESANRLYDQRADLHLPPSVRERHLLVVGKTGSGKTSRILLPMIWADLLDLNRTLIVLDAKGDLTSPVIEMAEKARGKEARVLYISFFEPGQSLAWNPLQSVTTRSGCREIALCLSNVAEVRESRDSSFFRIQAERMIANLIEVLQKDPSRCSPAGLKEILDLPIDRMTALARKMGAQQVLSQLGLAAGMNHNAETVLLEAQNYVAAFGDEDVRLTTATSEFHFDMLTQEPLVVILRFPEGVERLRPLHTVFVKRLFQWVVDTADRQSNRHLAIPISCFLDEFASALAKLPDIERTIHTFRSRGFRFTAAVQSLSQLSMVYGESRARVLADGFNSLALVSPVGLADASYASARSGMAEFVSLDTDGSGEGRILRETTHFRNVLSESEIALPPRHPDRGQATTFLLPDIPPFWAFLKPIWEYPDFSHWDWRRGGKGPVRRPRRQRKARKAQLSRGPDEGTNDDHESGGPSAITNTRGWSDDEITERLAEVKRQIGFEETQGSALKWWEAFEGENKLRKGLVLRLAEELLIRKATITEFFLSYVYSNTDSIQANLHYLDYQRLKKEEERRRREQKKKKGSDEED